MMLEGTYSYLMYAGSGRERENALRGDHHQLQPYLFSYPFHPFRSRALYLRYPYYLLRTAETHMRASLKRQKKTKNKN